MTYNKKLLGLRVEWKRKYSNIIYSGTGIIQAIYIDSDGIKFMLLQEKNLRDGKEIKSSPFYTIKHQWVQKIFNGTDFKEVVSRAELLDMEE